MSGVQATGGERRRALRYRPRDAQIELRGRQAPLSDLSTMGMHTLEVFERLHPGAVVRLELRLPRARAGRPPHRFALSAIVVAHPGAGTAFRYLQPSMRFVRALAAYLEANKA